MGLQRRRQRLPQLLEDSDLSLFPLCGRQPRIAAAFYGRKLIYILHSGLFLSLADSESGNAPARSRLYINAKKHVFARFSSTAANLSQYRPLLKSHATRSWYRRGYLAILTTPARLHSIRPFARLRPAVPAPANTTPTPPPSST